MYLDAHFRDDSDSCLGFFVAAPVCWQIDFFNQCLKIIL